MSAAPSPARAPRAEVCRSSSAPLDARLACARACGSLGRNEIGPEGGKQLAAALRGNKTLEELK